MHPARPQADNVTPTTAVTSSTTPASQTNNHIQLNHQSFFGIGSSGNPSISSSSMFANGGVKPAHNVAAAPVVQLPVKATATIAPVAPVSVTAAIKPVHTLELDHSASNNDPDASSAYVNPFERSAEQSPFKKMRKQVEQDLEVVEVADVPKESEMEAEPARDVQQKDDNEEDADETVAASTRVEVGSAIDDEQHGEDNLGEMEIHIDSDSDDSE